MYQFYSTDFAQTIKRYRDIATTDTDNWYIIMSDDEEYRAKKAFPITDLLGGKVNLKPGEAPADAIEYLKFVA